MNDDEIKNKGKIDFLAKYRDVEEEVVTNAQMLTFCPLHPKAIQGTEFSHVSFAYALLDRVDYFNGRYEGRHEEEVLHLTFKDGLVTISGFFLEDYHRRITRREIDRIRAVRYSGAELATLREEKNGKPIVVSLQIFLTDDPHENDRFSKE